MFLIEGKFYTIFSVLFGIGFSVMLSRAATRRLSFRRWYVRRVAILFAIGAAHAVLFWHNDILEAYAVCGALLLPLVTARDRTILALEGLAEHGIGTLRYAKPVQRAVDKQRFTPVDEYEPEARAAVPARFC